MFSSICARINGWVNNGEAGDLRRHRAHYKVQWWGALMFYFICAWMNDWFNNREAGDLRRHRLYYDSTVMFCLDLNVIDVEAKVIACNYWPRSLFKIICFVYCTIIRKRSSIFYNDVIMSAIASQITGVPIVCSTVCWGADQRSITGPCEVDPLW